MKNREKYLENISESIREGELDCFISDVVADRYGKDLKYSFTEKLVLFILWLDEEYEEPKVDWSKVAVDTPILVKNFEDDDWTKAHFAKYENGKVYAWWNGYTSWVIESLVQWNFAKLAEV